jgi:hypothetical protein
MNKIIEYQRQAYGETFQKFGATPDGVKWNNVETQNLRFERLIKQLKNDLHNTTIHDIGSGTSDFHKFLLNNNIEHKYSGTEIVQEMIDYSLNKYPEIELFNRDFLKVENEKYDFVFLSGTLNLKLNATEAEWMDFSLKLISKMFEHAAKAVSFNCLTSYNTFSQNDLMYYNPQDILDFCIKNLSRFVVVDNCYPLYEFTITVFKDDFIASKYKSDSFTKYFKKL